jgi:hypothetical protein
MVKGHEHELSSGRARAQSICLIHKLIWYKLMGSIADLDLITGDHVLSKNMIAATFSLVGSLTE